MILVQYRLEIFRQEVLAEYTHVVCDPRVAHGIVLPKMLVAIEQHAAGI
jgi:hypothetical protein